MTTTDGLIRLVMVATTSPMSRPAWRTTDMATMAAAAHEVDDVAAGLGVLALRADRRGERGAGRDRLEAAGVAAAAQHVVGAAHADVPEVAGGALGAALQDAAGHDAGADAGGDLDQDEVVDVAQVGAALAERHDVDVVVDEDRHGVDRAEVAGHVVAVPARA